MKYFSLLILFLLLSCGNKGDVLLPKSNVTIVSDVVDQSPIYIFFKTKGKDTLVTIFRNNLITSTNLILHIDKRLPIRLIIPKVMKLQKKNKNVVAHKNELTKNYYAYVDSISKNVAFLPFTIVYYKMEKPKSGVIVYFDKNNRIFVDGKAIGKDEVEKYIKQNCSNNDIFYCFDRNMSFDKYINLKIFVKSIEWKFISNQEFIY